MYKETINKKKRINGSVTVLVTMILIPCVFFTGFIVDLARLKLFTNQAMMVADTYGSAILSEYDGYLYTMYGLFAISQDGDLDIDAISEELKRTFEDGVNSDEAYMPYSNANIELAFKYISNSSMKNTNVLETQIADYMKYRIIISMVQEFDGGVLGAIDNMQHLEENLEAAKKMEDLSEECDDYSDVAYDYYKAFENIANSTGPEIKNRIDDLNNKIDNYNSALDTLASIRAESAETEEEQADKASRISAQEGVVRDAASAVNTARDDVNNMYTDSYNACVNEGQELKNRIQPFEEKKNAVLDSLKEGAVDPSFIEVAKKEVEQTTVVSETDIDSLNLIVLNNKVALANSLGSLNADQSNKISAVSGDYWSNIINDEKYQTLKSRYSGKGKGEGKAKDQAKQSEEAVKNEANAKVEESNAKEENAAKSTRDIPGIYASKSGSPIENLVSVDDLFSNLGALFTGNSGIAETLLDDYYLVEYDFGMFTSRITGVNSEEEGPAHTLVGYEFSPDCNYSYLGEIEYLIAGNTGEGSAKDNLAEVRNRIIAFRMLMNYISTYTCSAVNTAITEASAVGIAPPIIFALNQGMRIAIASFESYNDWDLMMDGEKTKLYKNEVDDFSSVQKIIGMVSGDVSVGGDSQSTSEIKEKDKFEIELGYEDYTKIMLYFFTNREQRIERTGNLIEMNINCVAQGLGASGKLSGNNSFQLDKAYTAVDATCKGQLPFAVMPKGFAQKTVPDKYGAILDFENRWYTYTVTRSY